MLRSSIPVLSVLAGLAMAHPAAARDCRPVEAPPGVRMPERAGCKPADPDRGAKPAAAKAGRAPGFIDLGNGTEVRIGGKAEVEVQGRR